jgi:signal transduction histidine kinase/ligand-binding sensor domain-containing protein
LTVRAVTFVVALAWWSNAFALNPALDISQYVHTAWKVRDGFTRGTIRAIAQTPDGYLWLGTEVGLLRFDGVRAVAWQPPSNQQLPSNNVYGLLVARDGTLWIGTGQGVASWKDGHFTRYDALAGGFVTTLVEDRDGVIWMTRFFNDWALCAIRQTRVTCYGEDGGPGAKALGLYSDGAGNLWVGTPTGVWRWKPGVPEFFPMTPENNGIQGLFEDRDGSLLLSNAGGIRRLVDGKAEMLYPFPSTMRQVQALKLRRDRDDGLWIGTSTRGLVHVHNGITDVFSQVDGLSGDEVTAMYEDREGSMWVATGDGLDRFRESAIVSYSTKQGLSNNRVTSVLAATDGRVWVGTFDGVDRWTRGQVSAYLKHRPSTSIFEDSQQRVWLSSAGGIGYLQNDRYVPLHGVNGKVTRAIVEDGLGTIWIANTDTALFRLARDSANVERLSWTALEHRALASAVAADPSESALWIGFYQGGVSYFKDGQVRAAYDISNGLAPGRVSALYVDRVGALWVAADGGLSRLKNGRISTLTSANGLPCDAAGWVIEDAARSLWLGMACGLVRIARSEIDAWIAATAEGANNRRSQLAATLFDPGDGVRTFVNVSYYTAPVARAGDGRLWFISQDGLSVLDPARLPTNALPPPVHIEQLTADRRIYESNAKVPVQLPALIRDLEIDYTALSLVAPEQMMFRYKLEGHDRDWQDVGTRRQAYYTDLRPGTYHFRVTASNNSGVWNDAGASLAFEIAPAYYQTTWFLALVAGIVLTLAWAAHRLRLRIVETHEREITALNEKLMVAQEQERIRIAGELHDGVMQEMLAATMMLGSAKRRLGDDSAAHATIDKVQQKLVQAGTEIRQLSHDLHPPALQEAGLPNALRSHCEQFSASCGIPVVCDADDSVEALSRGAALALFRIVQEALGNAVKHSKATRITVGLTRSDGQVTLTVSDNGVGFDRGLLTSSGGLGLITMRERAGQLNGRFEFESTPGRGTTITVVIPFR